jgi:hypothetical protein
VLWASSLPEVSQDLAEISPNNQNNYGLNTYKLKPRQQMNINPHYHEKGYSPPFYRGTAFDYN